MLPELERLTKRAGRIAQQCRQTPERSLKPDGSIVTNGDRAVETFLRVELTALLPGSTVWGEEQGHSVPGESGLWAVDPIDGTSNYAFGSPLWGVSIGLIQNGQVTLGAIDLPDLKETYAAALGSGATCNGQLLARIPVGPVRREELLSYNDHVQRALQGHSIPGKMRNAGAFVIDATFVAQQRYRGLLGVREKLYDVAASIAILTELGADIRYTDGTPLEINALLEDRKIGKPWMMFPMDSGFFAA